MNIIIKIKLKFFPKLISSNEYIKYLKKCGIKIGTNSYFFSPSNTEIDIQRPFALDIGNYCKISSGVKVICHDYSRSVISNYNGRVIGECLKTKIGNNVFIGMNSIILMGSNIGNNVIIGAGSIVKGTFPNNCVIAGNPARIICTLEEYINKRINLEQEECKIWIKSYFDYYGKLPSINQLGPFIFLFKKIDKTTFNIFKNNGVDRKKIIHYYKNSEYIIDYDGFCDKIFEGEKI